MLQLTSLRALFAVLTLASTAACIFDQGNYEGGGRRTTALKDEEDDTTSSSSSSSSSGNTSVDASLGDAL